MKFWNNKRVLITGGSGVIGRELIDILIENNPIILSTDKKSFGKANYRNFDSLKINLAHDNLQNLIKFKPDIIFHLAASFEKTKENKQFLYSNWVNNVTLCHRIMELIKKIPNLKVFVLASSYLVYSPNLYLSKSIKPTRRIHETDSINPRNLVGASKYYSEKELNFMKSHFNSSVQVISPRIYRVYGKGSKDIISRWVRAVINSERINVYNKENRFDFIYAGDVAEGLIRLVEAQVSCGEVNLGTGKAVSIESILNIVKKYYPNIKINKLGHLENYEASCADINKLKKLINWVPKTEIETGINKVFNYQKKIVNIK